MLYRDDGRTGHGVSGRVFRPGGRFVLQGAARVGESGNSGDSRNAGNPVPRHAFAEFAFPRDAFAGHAFPKSTFAKHAFPGIAFAEYAFPKFTFAGLAFPRPAFPKFTFTGLAFPGPAFPRLASPFG